VAGQINGLSPAFASDLDAWIEQHQPDVWLFGHTHRLLDATIHSVPVINVSLGYPDEMGWMPLPWRHHDVPGS
jgi:hypothetical protein